MSESKTSDGGECKTQEVKLDAKGEVVPQLTGEQLIEKVQEYFYGSEKLAHMFENFIKDGEWCVYISVDVVRR
jgi:hypothetical protein